MALVYRIFGLSRSQFRLSAIDGVLVLFLVLSLANVQLYSANPARMTAAFYDRIAVPVLLYWLVRVMEPKEEQLRRLMCPDCSPASGWVAPESARWARWADRGHTPSRSSWALCSSCPSFASTAPT
jgi:hypothetical protein